MSEIPDRMELGVPSGADYETAQRVHLSLRHYHALKSPLPESLSFHGINLFVSFMPRLAAYYAK